MVQLGESVPVSIGGFVDAAVFAPAAEERVDSGGCDGLVLARTETKISSDLRKSMLSDETW